MKRATACLITAAVALAGCGGAATSGPVAPGNAASLRADLAAVKAAAAAHEPGAAHAATARMRADVQRMLSTGALSAADGRAMLTALGQIDSRISVEVQAPTPPAAPALAPTGPAPGPPPGHGHHDHGPEGGGGDGGD